MTKVFDLAWEISGDIINLEQDAGVGEVHRIDLHPMHVRQIACELGMFTGDADAWRRIATLERRLHILLDRINRLDDWLNEAAQKGHEDLELETTFSFATWELASEFCADLGVTGALVTRDSAVTSGTGPQIRAAEEPAGKPSETPQKPSGKGVKSEVRSSGDQPLSTLERSSLTKLVVGMAIDGYGYVPTERRSSVIPEIGKALRGIGLSIEDDTVRKYVHEGVEQHIPVAPIHTAR